MCVCVCVCVYSCASHASDVLPKYIHANFISKHKTILAFSILFPTMGWRKHLEPFLVEDDDMVHTVKPVYNDHLMGYFSGQRHLDELQKADMVSKSKLVYPVFIKTHYWINHR